MGDISKTDHIRSVNFHQPQSPNMGLRSWPNRVPSISFKELWKPTRGAVAARGAARAALRAGVGEVG